MRELRSELSLSKEPLSLLTWVHFMKFGPLIALFTFRTLGRGMLAPRKNGNFLTINPSIDHFFFYCVVGIALLIIQRVRALTLEAVLCEA